MSEIPIHNRLGEVVAVALVDEIDFATLSIIPWHLGDGYAIHSFSRPPANPFVIQMHRLLIRPSGNKQIDHINGNRLDNRRSNLRLCTLQQNQWNRRVAGNRAGRKKGVTLDKRTGTWRCRLQHDGKMMSLGYYKSEDEAKAVYDRIGRDLRGDFFCA